MFSTESPKASFQNATPKKWRRESSNYRNGNMVFDEILSSVYSSGQKGIVYNSIAKKLNGQS